jgi:tRNA A37 methylthiotransferase MiaB
VRYANKLGIFTIGNFIIGAPMETHETIEESFLYIRECEFDQVNIKTLDYMMGSQLYDSVKDMAKGRSHLFACLENGLNRFTLQEILDIKNKFLTVYNGEKKERIMQKIIDFGIPYEV